MNIKVAAFTVSEKSIYTCMTWIKLSLECTLVFVDDVMTGSDERRTIANKNRERRNLPGDGDKCCAT